MYPFSYDHAYGALAGAAVGDAAGATLEFYRKGRITSNIAKHAMTMPGGGCLHVAPGQITDDTELALALSSSLIKFNPTGGYPADSVAESYIEWYKSNPFDMGNITAKAFSIQDFANPFQTISQIMIENSNQENIHSEANGSLMRITPVSIWCSRNNSITTEQIANIARQDALLSHPSDVCQDCNALYCIAQSYLIKHPLDADGAINIIEEYLNTNIISGTVSDWFLKDSKLSYLEIAKNVNKNIGWVRHGFTLSFHFLRNKLEYEEAIMKTLMCGGDTDTNACIVGGLMGALWGEPKIPLYMKLPVLTLDSNKIEIKDDVMNAVFNSIYKKKNIYDDVGYNRPSVYSTFDLYKIVNGLLGLDTNFNNGIGCSCT